MIKKGLIFSFAVICLSAVACAEDVKVTTYYPSPTGVYKNLQILNPDESTTITDFTQGLIKAGLNIATEQTTNAYTPGVFWSTTNDNPTKPKAGIWMRENATGSDLYLGTSNSYATGITNNGLVLSAAGNVGIGTTTPSSSVKLEISSANQGFLPPRVANTSAIAAPARGLVVYDLSDDQMKYWNGSQWKSMDGGGLGPPDYETPGTWQAFGLPTITDVTVTHGLGTTNTVIVLEFKTSNGIVHAISGGYVQGTPGVSGVFYFAGWGDNTNTTIHIYRPPANAEVDGAIGGPFMPLAASTWDSFRLRIWRAE